MQLVVIILDSTQSSLWGGGGGHLGETSAFASQVQAAGKKNQNHLNISSFKIWCMSDNFCLDVGSFSLNTSHQTS